MTDAQSFPSIQLHLIFIFHPVFAFGLNNQPLSQRTVPQEFFLQLLILFLYLFLSTHYTKNLPQNLDQTKRHDCYVHPIPKTCWIFLIALNCDQSLNSSIGVRNGNGVGKTALGVLMVA